jgi:hypothetical protein
MGADELRPPIALMAAVPVTQWPAGPGFVYEMEVDGFRMACFRTRSRG